MNEDSPESPGRQEIFEINDYNDWDHTIFRSAENFKTRNGGYPNILLANSTVLGAFDLFMSKKLLAEGKIEDVASIGQFECSKFKLEMCLDEQLKDHTFALIYDDQAEFIEEEPNDTLQEHGDKAHVLMQSYSALM